jgi:hypothetical protein
MAMQDLPDLLDPVRILLCSHFCNDFGFDCICNLILGYFIAIVAVLGLGSRVKKVSRTLVLLRFF